MKIKEDFSVFQMENEYYLIPTGGMSFKGVIKGNRTMGYILDALKEDTTQEKIVAKLKELFDVSGHEEDVEQDVKQAIEKLRMVGALEED